MGKKNEVAHNLHISKKTKFSQPKPFQSPDLPHQVPQQPKVGTNAMNQFK